MHSLPIFLRLTGKPVILIGSGPVAEAKRRLLERVGAWVVGEDTRAKLAIVVEDEAAVARLKARGVLVNAVDRPDLCDFTLPAIVDRDPVIVAVGTGGASAGLAAALRQRLESMLPANLGGLASQLHAARDELRSRYAEPEDRRRAIGIMINGAIKTGVLRVVPAEAGAADDFGDDVAIVTITSFDPDDLTLRAARLLGQADRIYHDPGVAPEILARARADAPRIAGAPPSEPEPGLTVVLERIHG